MRIKSLEQTSYYHKTAIKTQEIEFALSSLARKGLIKSIQNISPSQGNTHLLTSQFRKSFQTHHQKTS